MSLFLFNQKQFKFISYTHTHTLACNPYKHMDKFKIKHNFYLKNINNLSNYY